VETDEPGRPRDQNLLIRHRVPKPRADDRRGGACLALAWPASQ
jgi:hypothetical protein